MPQRFNAQAEYINLIKNNQLLGARPRRLLEKNGHTTATGIHTILNARSAVQQYQLDCAMWYAYIHSPQASPNRAEVCKRLFILLCYGGLIVRNKQSRWQSWRNTGLPLCAAVSHGGAVLVQVPQAIAGAFRDWFKGTATWGKRHGTHGIISDYTNPEQLPNGTSKYLSETRQHSGGKHRAINVGLGGVGKRNPFSGVTIAENGDHGHLYHYFEDDVGGNGTHAGMLIKCEDSAPPCFKGAVFSKGQGGHWHTFGAAGTFSATGGLKWSNGAHAIGPGYAEDNMFIDLDDNFLDDVSTGTFEYRDWMIGHSGYHKPATQGRKDLARIYTVDQWKAVAKQSHFPNKSTNEVQDFNRIVSLLQEHHAQPLLPGPKDKIRKWCNLWLSRHLTNAKGRGLVQELLRRAT